MKRADYQKRYENWWLGRRCRRVGVSEYDRVVRVELHGPPSFVSGYVTLHFEDGSSSIVNPLQSFRPRKRDVEVDKWQIRKDLVVRRVP